MDETWIHGIVSAEKKRFSFAYLYDFGDGWMHEVRYEKQMPPEPGTEYPRCLDGARACPPEDVGGVWGYEEFLTAIADPNNDQHEELSEWSPGFDAEKFDPEEASRRMQQKQPRLI